MKVLLDTNILIFMEDTGRRLTAEMAEIVRLCAKLHYELYIHPEQLNDIERDKNPKRRKLMLSRLEQYIKVPSPPKLTEKELNKLRLNQSSPNDKVDNNLLYTLYRGGVHFLVTDDIGIHKKAKQVGCGDSVFRSISFLTSLEEQIAPKSIPPSGLCTRFLHEIDVDQPLFNSLRASYAGFNEWFLRGAREHRKAWCIIDDYDDMQGICIFKEEENEQIIDNGVPLSGKILKLCTFKVSEQVRGRKYGERLLYAAFKYANEKDMDWVYLHTHGEEQHLLVALCEDYGFGKNGSYNGDDVLLKPMKEPKLSNLPNLPYAIKYYPHFKCDFNTQYFIVPIRPAYHDCLFADISEISNHLFRNVPSMYPVSANTIKKAYICNANTTKINTGDLLFFYRTEDRCSIEVIGIVEKAIRTNSIERVRSLTSKRTVFDDEELRDLLKNGCLVILFRQQRYINPIYRDKFHKAEIRGNIQTIRQIKYSQFLEIYNA